MKTSNQIKQQESQILSDAKLIQDMFKKFLNKPTLLTTIESYLKILQAPQSADKAQYTILEVLDFTNKCNSLKITFIANFYKAIKGAIYKIYSDKKILDELQWQGKYSEGFAITSAHQFDAMKITPNMSSLHDLADSRTNGWTINVDQDIEEFKTRAQQITLSKMDQMQFKPFFNNIRIILNGLLKNGHYHFPESAKLFENNLPQYSGGYATFKAIIFEIYRDRKSLGTLEMSERAFSFTTNKASEIFRNGEKVKRTRSIETEAQLSQPSAQLKRILKLESGGSSIALLEALIVELKSSKTEIKSLMVTFESPILKAELETR